jgi:hypothetical protein
MTPEEVNAVLAAIAARKYKPESNNKQYPYSVVHFDDLRPGTKSAYLVDGVVPRTGLVAVWGAPKSGKSFWTFDLVMHIACGWKYRGRRVEKGPVAYLAFEGGDGFYNRAEAFRRTHQINDEVWFYLLASNAKLVRDHKALIESMSGQIDRPPTCVVLDTLNRSIDGSESKDSDMGAYLAAAEVICDAFDCVVIIVHHCGVDGTRPRGHTSLTGAAAAQLSVIRDKPSGQITVEVEAMKDGAEGARFVSSLKAVEVGIDDNGQPITSCAILAVEGAASSKGKTAGARTTANQNRFLDIMRDAVIDAPEEHRTTCNIPGGRIAISREWLKMCCVAKGWLEDDSNNSRAKVSNMVNALAGKRILGASKVFVWLAQ